jgi:ABC-type phosphate/phosphonate transport system substrate-binding protein
LGLVLVLVGCGNGANKTPVSRPRPTPAPTSTALPPLPTLPPPGSTDNPLIVVLVNPSNTTSTSDVQALAKSLSDQTKLIVQVRMTTSYAEARQALCSGSASMISANAFAYLSAVEQACGEGLFTAEINNQTSTQGEMVAGLGRDIYTVKGFAGYRFCRPDSMSVNGWFVPTLSLKMNSIDPLGDLDSVIDSGSDTGVIKDILALKCDVGATKLGAEIGSPGVKSILIIEKLPPVPNDTVMISLQLDGRLRALLSDTLRGHIDDIAKVMGANSMVAADDKNFDELRKLFKAADLDVASMGQ